MGDEGQEFAQIDRDKLRETRAGDGFGSGPRVRLGPGPGRFLALLARDESGAAVGVLTLSTSFAVYAGGEYGVIDEMYVVPECRSQGIGRSLVEAAVAIARRERVVPAGCDGAGRGAAPRARCAPARRRRPGAPLLPALGIRAYRSETAAAGAAAARLKERA